MTENAWRRGAVLLSIAVNPPHGVLFVERASHLRRHPGQIGLPGGIVDPADGDDPEKTALRELREEIGVEAKFVTIAGRLPDVEQNLNRFIITPIVGTLAPAARFTVDGDEIAGVFVVPLSVIVAEGSVYEDAAAGPGRAKPMYALDYEGKHIWGFTGRVLKSFVDEWKRSDSALRRTLQAHGVQTPGTTS